MIEKLVALVMFLTLHVSAYEIVIDESLSRADKAVLTPFGRVQMDIGNYIQPAMIHIKTGSFKMGSYEDDDDEKPVHKVNITQDFYIGKYEVTLGEYRRCVEDSTCRAPLNNTLYQEMCLDDNCPVMNVSWGDAKAYIKWLSKQTGQTYRLPTEAEWEYVARAGTTTRDSTGNSGSRYTRLGAHAWYKKNSNKKNHKVGTKGRNPWGLYDIHGNVWEWCEDWYTDSYKNTPINGTDNSSGSQKNKVLRGGSWYSSSDNLRSSIRIGCGATERGRDIGFRLAGTLP